MCLEERRDPKPEYRSAPLIECVIKPILLAAKFAVLVLVKLPRAQQQLLTVAIEPLNLTIVILCYASCPAVCEPNTGTCRITVVNFTDEPIKLLAGFSIAFVAAVQLATINARTAVTTPAYRTRLNFERYFTNKKSTSFTIPPLKNSSCLRSSPRIWMYLQSWTDVVTTNLVFHKIDTGDVRPIRQFVHRLPYGEMRAAVESEIDKLVVADISRLSISPWASPVVMLRKKDGSWRLCVDYSQLNSVTKFDCFILPRLDKTLYSFAGATVLSSLNLAMAYHQVPVKPSDVEKTAFITHVGLFEMQKMPFGL